MGLPARVEAPLLRSDLINEAERRLWDAFSAGTVVDLGPGDPTGDGFNPDDWTGARAVRGEVISRLLLGVRPPEAGYAAKIVLAGARITGRLDLSGSQEEHELLVRRCWLDAPLDLTDSITRSVEFSTSRIPGMNARCWHANGQVSFWRSFFAGQADLLGARLAGEVTFRDARLSNPDGIALLGDNLVVEGSMYLDNGFHAKGKVRLAGARIGGLLCFDRATLSNAEDDTLTLDNASIGQNCFCREGFSSDNQIRMLGATVEGQLSFNDAILSNPRGNVVFGDNLTVAHSMFFQGATCDGTVRLRGARVGGQMNFDDAKLHNPRGVAISAEHLTVGRDMVCRFDFEARGEIQMGDARVGGQLSFSGGRISHPNGFVADLQSLETEGLHLDTEISGRIDLRQARIGLLHLPAFAAQPPMRLSGLVYGDLNPDPDPPVKERVAWLRRDPDGFHPQPYEQLAGYYRGIGHDREARLVLLAKRRSRRARLPMPLRFPGWLLDGLAGYGYVPLRAFCWLLLALTAGTLAFRGATGVPAPTGEPLLDAFLLALDTVLPTSPFGLRAAAQLTPAIFGTAITLQIIGYALALAVIPAVSRSLSRSDK